MRKILVLLVAGSLLSGVAAYAAIAKTIGAKTPATATSPRVAR